MEDMEDEVDDAVLEADAEAEAEETSEDDSWIQEYGGLSGLREKVSNLEKMQEESHRRNEDARRERERAQELYELALRNQRQPEYQGSPSTPQKDDFEELDGEYRDLAKALHGRLSREITPLQQQLVQSQFQIARSEVERSVDRIVSRGGFGFDDSTTDTLVKRFTEQAFQDPAVTKDTLPKFVRQWAEEEKRGRDSLREQMRREVLAELKKNEAKHVPTNKGPRKSVSRGSPGEAKAQGGNRPRSFLDPRRQSEIDAEIDKILDRAGP